MRAPRIALPALVSLLLIAPTTGCPEAQHGLDIGGPEVRSASDLPVSRVVLYRSGIAYVERQGEVEDNVVSLQIEPSQINDILTTLTVIVDRGENLAASIGLPIERTVANQLNNLPPQVRQQGGMLALLNAFRGAWVDIRTGSGSASGRVVGTEALVNDEGNQIRRVTLMSEEGELRQFRVDEIIEVTMQNETLAVGLSKSLDVSLGEGDWKPVELTLRLSGEAPHEVFVSYVVAMPTWKPTYRVLLEDEQVHLQGWAVIDNVSGENWNDVSLSLVAGTPISFTYDLHSPHFVARPDLTSRGFVDEMALLAPEIDRGIRLGRAGATSTPTGSAPGYYGGEALAEAEEQVWQERERRPRRSSRRDRGDEGYYDDDLDGVYAADEPALELSTGLMLDSMGESVSSEQLESLFRYDLGQPVTVHDRGSALVAIINESVDGEDVLYFDPSGPTAESRTTPYRSIRMENNTAFTVERGPLSIFSQGTFVGQAIAPRIGEGEMIFLPYSLDGRFRITERHSSGEEGLRLLRIVNSVIYSEVQSVSRRTYQITNNSGESAKMFIRVPKRTNWTLRTPSADDATILDQGAVWFVPVELTGEDSQEFVIEEVTTVTRSVEIWSGLAAEVIGLYVTLDNADPEMVATLQSVLEQRNRIADIEVELRRSRRLRDDAYERMRQLRLSIDTLGDSRSSRQLQRELEERLGEQVEQTETLTADIIRMEEEERDLRARINTTLMDLTLEPAESDE